MESGRPIKPRWMAVVAAIALATAALGGGTAGAGTIRGSKHDLSVGGEGPVTATSEQQVCLFCHVPHRATSGSLLANRRPSDAVYTTYTSTTTWSIPLQPGGSATLCLSCHDGTVALGDLGTGTRSMANTGFGGVMPVGPSLLGTDLRDDHPVSLLFPAGRPEVSPPPAGDPVRLDAAGRVQCTSCHNPHDPTHAPFLVKAPDVAGVYGGALCLTCHHPAGWTSGAHAEATAVSVPLSLARSDPPETVALLACAGCHQVHTAGEPMRLGRGLGSQRCLVCHQGTTAPDVAGELSLPYRHPVGQGIHDAAENRWARPPAERHAECADCHRPHAAARSNGTAGPAAPASLRGVDGISAQYVRPWAEPAASRVSEVSYEYQLCFKCHSGWSYGLTPPVSPSRRLFDGVAAPAQVSPALGVNPQNGGGHAVVAPHQRQGTGAAGAFRGTDRAGNPWSWDSILLCTDCHGPETSRPAPAGPHGSTESFILRAPWIHPSQGGTYAQPLTGTPGTGGHLCFLCHDPATYLDGQGANTGFSTGYGTGPAKNLHGGMHHQTACTACHAGVPHGYRNRAMMVEEADPYPYNAGARVTFAHDSSGNPVLPPSGAWSKTDCQTSCHH